MTAAVQPMNAKYPLTIFFNPTCGDAADIAQAKAKDTDNVLVLVDITAPGFKAADYGIAADAVGMKIFAKDAAGNTFTGSDALHAAYNGDHLGNYFKYTRSPGFKSTCSGVTFGSR